MRRPEAPEPSTLSEAPMAFLVRRAREMRKGPTPSEAILWQHLRGKQLDGVRFRRQHPFGDVILDFYAPSVKLAVEVDGSTHDPERDARRDRWLARRGVRVVRVKAWMVERHVSVVLGVLRAAV